LATAAEYLLAALNKINWLYRNFQSVVTRPYCCCTLLLLLLLVG
jgi:hypothetical protein